MITSNKICFLLRLIIVTVVVAVDFPEPPPEVTKDSAHLKTAKLKDLKDIPSPIPVFAPSKVTKEPVKDSKVPVIIQPMVINRDCLVYLIRFQRRIPKDLLIFLNLPQFQEKSNRSQIRRKRNPQNRRQKRRINPKKNLCAPLL